MLPWFGQPMLDTAEAIESGGEITASETREIMNSVVSIAAGALTFWVLGMAIKTVFSGNPGNPGNPTREGREWVVVIIKPSDETKRRIIDRVKPVGQPAGVRLHSLSGMAFFKFENIPTQELANRIAQIAREEGSERVEVSELTGPKETERDYE